MLLGVLGVVAELVQLTRAQLAQLQLGVGSQDRDHIGGGRHRQLRLVQLQLDVQAHLDGVGGRRRRHPELQHEWQLWLW